MASRQFQLCGIGNALIDILVEVSESEFANLGLERGTQALISQDDQAKLLANFSDRKFALVSGGSNTNSVICFAGIGGRAAMQGAVGKDAHGEHFVRELTQLGIHAQVGVLPALRTGTCATIITPDGERTMRTFLGAGATLGPDQVSEEVISQSDWIFLEGYMFGNPKEGVASVMKALEYSQRHKTKVAFTCSESWVIDSMRAQVNQVVDHSSLVFCNLREALTLSGKKDIDTALAALKARCSGVVITNGEQGAKGFYGGKDFSVPAFPCKPVDLTGAGDAFAGAFLFGLMSGLPLEKTASTSCYVAREVITQIGARLKKSYKATWEQGLKA